jgi:predicted dehydrogenase
MTLVDAVDTNTQVGLCKVAFIGSGGMARSHLRNMLKMTDSTQVIAVCEPSEANYDLTARMFADAGQPIPPNQPDYLKMLETFPDLNAVFIITPHAYHHDQTKACLEAGLDVLLEKPMVMNAAEAESLIAVRDRTGRLLVVAFQGSLSPQVRKASAMIKSGEVGQLLNISATVWQDWDRLSYGTWRQELALAGGGFLFDTGAHMLNTICDLANEDFAEVAAWFDNRGRTVEIAGTVMGRLKSGALVTMNACGNAIKSCASDVRVYCSEAIIHTGIWGEKLEMMRPGETEMTPVPVPASLGVWEQFMAVRAGRIANPSPPEIGLRMARLYDAIRTSASQNGQPVLA